MYSVNAPFVKMTGDSKVESKAESKVDFDELESDYNETLEALRNQESAENFSQQYQKLHRALTTSHESESRLIEKTKELVSEINVQVEKINRSRKEDEEIQAVKASTQEAIESNWQDIKAIHDRERNKREKISKLDNDVSALRSEVERGSGWNDSQERHMIALKKKRDDIQRRIETKTSTLETLRMEVVTISQKMSQELTQKAQLNKEVNGLDMKIEQKRSETTLAEERKQRLDAGKFCFNIVCARYASFISDSFFFKMHRTQGTSFKRGGAAGSAGAQAGTDLGRQDWHRES